MAKFNSPAPRATTPAPAKAAASGTPAPIKTEVRNTPIPKVASAKITVNPAGKQVSYDQIARKAYEIWQSGSGGSEFDNWIRAERELRGL